MNSKSHAYVSASCPVCNYTLANSFFDGGKQTLATLGLPNSTSQAQAMAYHPLDYVQCPRCTHIWNRSFNYASIPYTNNPNRMFNQGVIWQGHLSKTKNLLLSWLPKNPIIIDIGCGEGHFVRGLSQALKAQGRFIGFDPNTTSESGVSLEFFPHYFDPLSDIPKYSPDLLIMLHVLEHLLDPAAFIDQLA
jgi:2-polyprenyl-3-methyl-5-hydroxy-6-metoxy-1,4-benzoquinol methylase